MRRHILIACVPLALVACSGALSRERSAPAPRFGTAAGVDEAALSARAFHDALRNRRDVILLDVRTPDEFAQGHLPNARFMDVLSPDFDTRLASLDPAKTYLAYCRTGKRSAVACRKLSDRGLDCRHLQGGISAWRAADLPITQP